MTRLFFALIALCSLLFAAPPNVLYRGGFIDDHERPIEPILTLLQAATAEPV
jgi:hypothetical protein